jgi:hypothetical protein
MASSVLVAPTVAMAANQAVAVDTKVLTNAKVERNGKRVGTVQRVMVDPTTGRILHLDIVMTEGPESSIRRPSAHSTARGARRQHVRRRWTSAALSRSSKIAATIPVRSTV